MIKCAVPFITSFHKNNGHFRNCCATSPELLSKDNQSWKDWWNSKELNSFRESLKNTNDLPKECEKCRIQEKAGIKSFRQAVNSQVNLNNINSVYPSRWHLTFGNICNLACWTCSENSSSTIQAHKNKIGILSKNFVDPQIRFLKMWDNLKQNILNSYDHHEVVSLTLLGGEPTYNPIVLDFLQNLIDLKLSKRTKLEFHTNATRKTERIENVLKSNTWKYVSTFLSIDAVGKKAEWLRYGTDWKKLESNIPFFKSISNYIEVHCTLSVLNLNDLPKLKVFCNENNLSCKIAPIFGPWFMAVQHWDQSKDMIADEKELQKIGLEEYYNLIGKEKKSGAFHTLIAYIQSFSKIRKPLKDFDPILAKKLDL